MADAIGSAVAPPLRGHPAPEPPGHAAGAAVEGLFYDLFDDPVLRSAMGRAAGMRPLSPCVVQHLVAEVHAAAGPDAAEPALNGLFQRRRLGLRRWEWAPYGLYAPVCADPQRAD
jgi:hypothetical protein